MIFTENFSYANGSIIATSTNLAGTTTNWFRHSGSAAPSDAIVANSNLQVSSSGSGTPPNTVLPRQDDINRPFTSETNATIVVFASFTVNCTNLPPAVGTYFAHFYVSSSALNGRVFAQAGTLPGTWRLGVSGANNAVSRVYPVDLATNINYQVALQWDPVSSFAATLWVNPLSSADSSVSSIDAVTSPAMVRGFGFRQAGSFGNFFANITNLAVGTTFEEAATNVWPADVVAPIVAYHPKAGTNFVGDVVSLYAVAAGQGLGGFNYQWKKNGADIANPDGNTNVFTIPSAVAGDSGNYSVVATSPNGLSATSAAGFLWVTNPPVPPTVIPATNSTVLVFNHQNASLHVIASGPPPISFAWYYNNGALGPNVSGDGTDTITINDVTAINGTAGSYYCVASNPFGNKTSGVFTVTATAPPSATIGQLRTMVDSTFFLPTNTTALWTVTGTVTTYTNITTPASSSFYMQDGTGGINVFFAGNTEARPEAGDNVTVVGPLGQFNSLLELNLTATDPAHSVVTNSSGNPLPPAVALPFSFTNNPSASNAIRFYQGALVTLTNVYFPPGFTGTNNFGSGVNVIVTNAAGETFPVRVDSRVGDIIGRRVPPYGWTVTGPMGFFLNATAPDRSAGFQLLPTRFADIVSQMPASVTYSGGNPVVTWVAGPNVPYSVWRAADVSGTYAELATGLVFGTTAGTFTDTSAPGGSAYYKITSP